MTPQQEKRFDDYIDQGRGSVCEALAYLGLEKEGPEPDIPEAVDWKNRGPSYYVKRTPEEQDQVRRGVALVKASLRGSVEHCG